MEEIHFFMLNNSLPFGEVIIHFVRIKLVVSLILACESRKIGINTYKEQLPLFVSFT